MKKLSLFIFCLTLKAAYAQVLSGNYQYPTTPKFANSSETNLQKDLSDAQINYSTGTAIINLPIYAVSTGPLSVSVGLNYAATGIKVDEEAGWVGLGWALNAGATISRQIKGLPDESFYLAQGQVSSMSNQSWIQLWINDTQNIMNLPLIVPSAINQSATYGGFSYYFDKTAKYLTPCSGTGLTGFFRDIQPDLYTLNLNGRKIEFIFDLNQQPVILNDNGACKILHNNWDFTVIDETGTSYFFKSTDAEKIRPEIQGSSYYLPSQSSLTYFDFNWWNTANATYFNGCSANKAFGIQPSPRLKWNLTKIQSPDGKYSIDFEYDDYAHYEYNLSYIYNIHQTTLQEHSYYYPDIPFFGHIPYHGNTFQSVRNCYYSKRIKKISWQEGYMTFEAGALRNDVFPFTNGTSTSPVNDARSLDKIKVFNTANTELHRFELGYGYFNSAINTSDGLTYRSKRLKLLSLTEYGSNLTAKPPYLFEYDNTALPVRFSFEKDFWGYYKANGANSLKGTNYFYSGYSNTNLNDFVPWSHFCIYPLSFAGVSAPVTVSGVDRLPNLANTQSCVLKKITNPLKGYQLFDYELNTFCVDNDFVNRNAGGLRIKKLTTGDGINATKDIVKNFYYDYETVTLPNSSVKRSSGEINYLPVFGRDAVDVYYQAVFSFYKIHSDNFASTVNGAPSQVYYREVKVEEPGKGCTIYKFDNAGTFGHSKDFMVGSTYLLEKSKSDIAHSNNSITNNLPDRNDVMTKRTNFPYAPEPTTDWANGILRETEVRNQQNDCLYKKKLNYIVKNYNKMNYFEVSSPLESITELASYSLSMNRSISITPYYYLSIWKVLDNETEYTYNPAYPGNNSLAQVKTTNYFYNSSNHRFITSSKSTNSDGTVIEEKYNYVADFSAANPTTLNADVPSLAILNMRYKTNQLSNIVEHTSQQTKASVTEVLSSKLLTYKDLNNSSSSSAQTNNPPVIRTFEDYNLQLSAPLAVNNFNPAAFNLSSSNLSFTFDSRYRRESTGQLFDSQGNLLQSKVEYGPESSYIYGYNKTVPIAQAVNAKYSEIAHTSFESEEINTWTQLNPANITNSDKKTGEVCYSINPATSQNPTVCDVVLDKGTADINQVGKYTFSCWVKTPTGFTNNTANLVVHSNNGTSLAVAYPLNAAAYRSVPIQNTNGKWAFYSVTIDLAQIRNASSLSAPPTGPNFGLRFFVSNTSTSQGVLIDDVRILPATAFMNTTTFKPLIGGTSQTDARNAAETYEYDVFGRPVLVRDLNNNIMQKTIYNIK